MRDDLNELLLGRCRWKGGDSVRIWDGERKEKKEGKGCHLSVSPERPTEQTGRLQTAWLESSRQFDAISA